MKTAHDCICIVEKLTKEYNGFKAVDGISFCVRRGEIFGFLGPNGAGKTTTVRMLCGLTRITRGKAFIDGLDVTRNYRDAKKIIGVVPDISNMYPELSCWDNLVFCCEMYGVPRRERSERVEELLRFFGLWRWRDTKFKNLSKGLKRRLTIAAALVHNPKMLFLDEPTIGLDVLSKRAIWDVIGKLNRKGVTIFLTTHNIYEAFRICHRIAVISRGRITAIGSPEELKRMVASQEVIEVAFSPQKVSAEELRKLKSVVHVVESNGIFKLAVNDALTALEEVVKLARSRGLSLSILNLKGADAEDVFLKLIGEKHA